MWKQPGETPLQALGRLRKELKIGSDVKMTYAGRLDPLAEGEIIVLTGDECKNKDKYLTLDKEYEVEILFGAKTDTGDVMGKIVDGAKFLVDSFGNVSDDILRSVLQEFVGTVRWEYPAFSSKTVQGKPLFLWALEGKLSEIDEIPMRESEIYELELLDSCSNQLSVGELRDIVREKIDSVKPVVPNIVNGKDSKMLGADFRRSEIKYSWNIFFDLCEKYEINSFHIARIRCKCSSGTYMRTLAEKVGKCLNMPSLAFSITRTRIML